MQVLYEVCCGLDVHTKTVVACLLAHWQKELCTVSMMTEDVVQLVTWLAQAGGTHVAIESTGVYWKPVFNLLEGRIEVILVNTRHLQAVPGHKTDARDSAWLADLLRHGLLRPSLIPPAPRHELHELTRYRHTLVAEQATVANRLHKLVESGNIKPGQVASDLLRVSGQRMLRPLAAGETDANTMAAIARGRLKRKTPELRRALAGWGGFRR